ncbi:MAG: HAD-IB family hydrolase [Bacteroidia bacterium]|nr:HAD-IB family hydrolase [Bacteroidia bacterium]
MSSTQAPDTLAVFDFDGTLTTQDSMLAFCHYVVGPRNYALGLLRLAPLLLGFKFRLVSNVRAKEAFMSAFLGGRSIEELERYAQRFCEEVLPTILRPGGLAAIDAHKASGHELLLITASLELWVKPWASNRQIPVLGSVGEYSNGIFTGKLTGNNCHGPEKVLRLQAWLGGKRPARVIAYGDSLGDKELLAYADEAFFKPWRVK